MSELQNAVRKYLGLPWHKQIKVVYAMGVEGSVRFDQSPHEMDIDFFKTVAMLNLKDRFIYEMELVK